jgi:hypothetical protein
LGGNSLGGSSPPARIGVRSRGGGYITRALHNSRPHTTEKEAEMYIGSGVLLLILLIVLLVWIF